MRSLPIRQAFTLADFVVMEATGVHDRLLHHRQGSRCVGAVAKPDPLDAKVLSGYGYHPKAEPAPREEGETASITCPSQWPTDRYPGQD